MGEYFYIVNPAKRQYLDPSRFGENCKRSGILRGKHAVALGLLLFDNNQHPGTHHLIGSWIGDPVVVAGDYAAPLSDSDPPMNLHQLAYEQFEDVSLQAMLMLIADDEEWANKFARDVEFDNSLLVELGQLVFKRNCEPLRRALEETIGSDWPRRYKEVCSRSATRQRYRLSGDKSRYRLEVADIIGVPDLAAELNKSNPGASVELFLTSAKPSVLEAIVLGTNVPAEVAVKAIQLAVKHWSFLRYVLLSNELEDPPAFLHDEIWFGSGAHKKSYRELRPWTENDFNGLHASMSLSELHRYIRAR